MIRVEHLIKQAILEKKLLRFQYASHERVGEPHVLGIRGGVTQLLLYQLSGGSASGRLPQWRRFDIHKISKLVLLERTFSGSRPAPSGKHATWDVRLAYVP